MSENNHMWTAIAILGGIYAYSMLKEDAGKLKDSVVDLANEAAKEVKIAVDPTDSKNLASRTARGVFGEDNIINGVGGAIARVLGTDPMKPKKSTQPTPNAPKEYQSYNPRAANYRASTTKPTTTQKTEAGLPARQVNGKWLKFENGTWKNLTRSDKVFTIRGQNVVHPYTWKPS